VTEPNEFEEFLARRERQRRIAIRIIRCPIGLALAAIVVPDPEDDLLLRVVTALTNNHRKEPLTASGHPIN